MEDPILRTWFTLVEPVVELLEMGMNCEAVNNILGRIDTYTAPIWEDIVRTHLLVHYADQ